MSSFLLRTCGSLARVTSAAATKPSPLQTWRMPPVQSTVMAAREMSNYFGEKSADELWKAATSVSSQGRQKGRAKGLMRRKNFNVGQRVGYGPAKIYWPGLNKEIKDREKNFTKISDMPTETYDTYKENKDLKKTSTSAFAKRVRQTPLERGWTSASPQGKVFWGPISPDKSLNYDGFKSVLIEFKVVTHMTGTLGRVRSNSLLMVTGNQKGLAGFSLLSVPTAKTTNRSSLFSKAINKSGLKLAQIGMYEDRTVFHDFFSRFGAVTLVVKQKPRGFGVKAHRVLKACCNIIGIKDVEILNEGAHNYNAMVKALFLGLLRQRTHQMLADEMKLHLVELREENDFYPKVVASPSDGHVRTQEEILPNEILDFDTIAFEGNLPNLRTEQEFDITKSRGYENYVNQRQHTFHYEKQKIQMHADYGEIRSHLTDRYPECIPQTWTMHRLKKAAEEGGSEEQE